MPNVDTLEALFVEELRDMLDAERRLTEALPKVISATTDDELESALTTHLAETEVHVTRLEEALEAMAQPARARSGAGMRGIIEEVQGHIGNGYADGSLRDAQIIGGAQRVEHYEIAAYGTAIAHAQLLGLDPVVESLKATLEEEKAADARLSKIAESIVNLNAARGDAMGGPEVRR